MKNKYMVILAAVSAYAVYAHAADDQTNNKKEDFKMVKAQWQAFKKRVHTVDATMKDTMHHAVDKSFGLDYPRIHSLADDFARKGRSLVVVIKGCVSERDTDCLMTRKIGRRIEKLNTAGKNFDMETRKIAEQHGEKALIGKIKEQLEDAKMACIDLQEEVKKFDSVYGVKSK